MKQTKQPLEAQELLDLRETLTKKQWDFVLKFIETGVGTTAALAVYDTDDYGTASSIANENLKKPAVKSAIQQLLSAREVPSYLQKLQLIDFWREVAFEGKVGFKGSDRIKATELLGKFEGMFVDKQQIDVHLHGPTVYLPEQLPEE